VLPPSGDCAYGRRCMIFRRRRRQGEFTSFDLFCELFPCRICSSSFVFVRFSFPARSPRTPRRSQPGGRATGRATGLNAPPRLRRSGKRPGRRSAPGTREPESGRPRGRRGPTGEGAPGRGPAGSRGRGGASGRPGGRGVDAGKGRGRRAAQATTGKKAAMGASAGTTHCRPHRLSRTILKRSGARHRRKTRQRRSHGRSLKHLLLTDRT